MAKNFKHNIDPQKIHLLQIEPLKVSIADFKEKIKEDESIDFKIGHRSAHNLEEKGFLMGLELVLTLNDREEKDEAIFRYNFHFTIENLEQMYNLNEDGKPIFHKLFGATLAGISYSTLRGIVFERLLQSSWGSITLPILDPNSILDSWIEVDVSS